MVVAAAGPEAVAEAAVCACATAVGVGLGVADAVVVGDAVAIGDGDAGALVGAAVGGAVGGAVGAIVGGAVGAAVGAGVGAGVGGPTTFTVPRMNAGWTSQWYANVPARGKTTVRLPVTKIPVSQDRSSAVAEWDTPLSKFVHVTESPALIVTDAGWNEISRIATDALAAFATAASAIHATAARAS